MEPKQFCQTVDQFADQLTLLPQGARVVCAVSGGADSVALLRWLLSRGAAVIVAHCNFHLRADESDGDEQFVRALCEQLHVECHVAHFNTSDYAHSHYVSIEMAARQLRYDFFEQLRQQQHAEVIAVAHHRDDNTETLLLNLLRGTGLKGLCSMQPKKKFVVRPFLCVSHQQILNYLAVLEQPFRTDSSNLETNYLRNRVRLQLLPLMEQMQPSAASKITTAIENLNQVNQIVEQSLTDYLHQHLRDEELAILDLLTYPSPITLLHHWLQSYGFHRTQLQQLLSSVHHPGAQFLSATHKICVNSGTLSLHPLQENIVPPRLKQTIVPNSPSFVFNSDKRFAYFDADKLSQPLTIRQARPGDRFQPFGMNGSKLVSDYLTDLKLTTKQKQQQFLLCSGNNIAWVIGLRPSNRFRVTSTTTRILICELYD